MTTSNASPATPKKRIVELDTMRGIAITLMVLGHSFLVYPVDIFHMSGYHELHIWIYTFHMGMLFLVAGAVYKCRDYWQFFNKKVDRILVPYIVFGLLCILFHTIGGSFVHVHDDVGTYLKGFLLYGGGYWFLYTIFIIFVIYPWIEKIFDEPWKELILVLALLIVYDFKLPGFMRMNDVIRYIPLFIIGKYAVKRIDTFKPKNGLQATITVIGMAVLWAVSNYYCYHGHTSALLRVFRMMSMITLFFIFAVYLNKWASKGNKWAERFQALLGLCSQYSLQIYLFEAFFMVVIRTIIINVLHITHPALILFLMVTINIATTLILCHYVLKRNKWIAWLVGLGNRPWKKTNP